MIQALSLRTDTQGVFDWHATYSDYRYLKDHSRSASSYGQSLAGKNNVLDGTGWQTGDWRGIWRPAPLFGQTHTVSFGYHIDAFKLKQHTYALANWHGGPNGDLTAASHGKTRTQALYVQDVWDLAPRWRLTLGGRQEYWRAFDGVNLDHSTTPQHVAYPDQHRHDFSPKAALSFDVTPDLMTRLSFGRAIRYPTVTELYQQVTSGNELVQNNPNLRPEDVHAYDWTTVYTQPAATYRISVFRENRRHALFSQTDTSISPNLTQIENIDRVRIWGIETAVDAHDVLVHGLDVSGSVTYAESTIPGDTHAPAAVGKQFPRIPRWRARASLVYRPSERLSYALGYRYSSGAFSQLLNTDVNHDVYGGISHYSVFDAKLSYHLTPRLTGSVGIDNLGNEKYYVSPHPYPQRTAFAGLHYDY